MGHNYMLGSDNDFLCYLFQGTIIFKMAPNRRKGRRRKGKYLTLECMQLCVWYSVHIFWTGQINGENLSHLQGLVGDIFFL